MDWKAIKAEYESSTITLKALAEKYGISEGTMRSRKNREKWKRNIATQRANVATGKAASRRKNKPPPEPVIDDEELTEKQRLFCFYYVKSFNATTAALKAGYALSGAHVEGSRLLKNAKISAYIRAIKAEMHQELFIDAKDVLNKYIQIAFTDITDFLVFGKKAVPVIGMMGPIKDEKGKQLMKDVNYVDFHESTQIDGSLINEVKQGREGISIKLADKMKALEKLELYFDLLPDKFKRRLEEEKLKAFREKLDIEKQKLNDGEEEVEDDGFLEALNGRVNEVWDDEDSGES